MEHGSDSDTNRNLSAQNNPKKSKKKKKKKDNETRIKKNQEWRPSIPQQNGERNLLFLGIK